MATFSTAFVPPPPPAGLTVYANVPASAVELDWNATALGSDFGGYRVYRSLDQGQTFELLALITSEVSASYNDYAAPLDTQLLYSITVANLDYESAPSQASSELDIAEWWLVRPGDLDLTFHLRHVDGYEDVTPRPSEAYVGVGADFELVVEGKQLGVRGSISVVITREDRELIVLTRRLASLADEYALLKSPFGEVYPIKMGEVRRTRGEAGIQTLSFPFAQVA